MIQLTYAYKCDICGASEAVTYNTGMYLEVLRPCAPPGWRMLDDQLICSRHSVRIMPYPASLDA